MTLYSALCGTCLFLLSTPYVQKHLSTTYSIVPAQPRTSQASADGTGSSMSCSTREGWKGMLAPTYSGPTRLPAKSLTSSPKAALPTQPEQRGALASLLASDAHAEQRGQECHPKSNEASQVPPGSKTKEGRQSPVAPFVRSHYEPPEQTLYGCWPLTVQLVPCTNALFPPIVGTLTLNWKL